MENLPNYNVLWFIFAGGLILGIVTIIFFLPKDKNFENVYKIKCGAKIIQLKIHKYIKNKGGAYAYIILYCILIFSSWYWLVLGYTIVLCIRHIRVRLVEEKGSYK
jgi:hypothetical protein